MELALNNLSVGDMWVYLEDDIIIMVTVINSLMMNFIIRINYKKLY